MLLRLRYRKFMVKYLFLFVAASTCLTGMAGAEEPVVSEAQPLVAEAAAVAPEAVADSGPSVELLDLRQAQELALRDNPSLQAIEARVGQAQQRVAQARSAYFPQANVEYQATHTDLPDNTVNGLREQAWRQVLPNAAQASLFGGIAPPTALGAFSNSAYTMATGIRTALSVPDDTESYDLSLNLSYLVFDGFARTYNHRAAKFGAQEWAAAQRDAQRQLVFGVAQAYYAILLAKENRAIAQADLDFNARLLKEAQLSKEAGVGALSDVLNFEVRQRAAESNLISAEGSLKAARIALAALLGMAEAAMPDNLDVAPLMEETSDHLQLPDPEVVIAKAVEHRPDLEQARLSVSRSGALAKAARSSFMPRVAAFASRSASLPDNDSFEQDNFATTVGLNVSYDLFTGGRNIARTKEAKLAKKQSERELEQVELDALAEVRQAWVGLEESQQQLVLQRTTADLVRRNRELVEKEYDAGQGALVRLNEAQRDLVAAQSRLALARVGLFLAQDELRAATGESLLDFNIE
jgi:outer membrane protein TolC